VGEGNNLIYGGDLKETLRTYLSLDTYRFDVTDMLCFMNT